MSHYTDEDVIAGTQAAIARYKAERGITGNTYIWEGVEPEVRAVLDAVAPAIAARALREFATDRVVHQTPARLVEDMFARADEIENRRV